MSGSRADFAGDAMFPIVRAAQTVKEVLGEPPVIVGGLAVMCRLQTAYRATVDVDVVDRRRREARHVEVLRRVDGASDVIPSGVLLPTASGQVRVDVLEVNQAEIDHPSDDPGDRLHATSHAWAHDSATPVTISARSRDGDVVEVVALVSEPGPLVAMKLQAVMDRPRDKAGTDLLDLVQLTLDRHCGPVVVQQIHSQPDHVREDVRSHVELWLADRREESLDRMVSVGGEVSGEDLDLVHDVLVDAVTR